MFCLSLHVMPSCSMVLNVQRPLILRLHLRSETIGEAKLYTPWDGYAVLLPNNVNAALGSTSLLGGTCSYAAH